jgi:signal transduction histidine kinase
MFARRLITGYDERRLRNLLVALFLALAVPTAVLIWQAFGQLKWEAIHHYRTLAEEMTGRIDAALVERMRSIDARSFADYAFLVASGDPSANLVQRSPLSSFPVQEELPGLIGYFQVDAQGGFSTPILPPHGADARSFGIGDVEYRERLQLASQIQQVLAANRLVRPPSELDARHDMGSTSALSARAERSRTDDERQSEAAIASGTTTGVMEGLEASPASPTSSESNEGDAYSQRIFDALSDSRTARDESEKRSGRQPFADRAVSEDRDTPQAAAREVDAGFDSKQPVPGRAGSLEELAPREGVDDAGRAMRKEQSALPEPVAITPGTGTANDASPAALRISTFESEIGSFEFSRLGSGHFVLFRRVWRNGERYIQGLLLDAETFTQELIGAQFAGTALAPIADLIVAYDNDVLRTFDGAATGHYPVVADEFDGTVLYRSRLTSPLSRLQLLFSLDRLPPGPGARVLGWATLVIAIVFVAGFTAFYRLGVSQIELARQQQDFVSAVSHELRTPLTSIRMYGEMLREGWVPEEKRQACYGFIHDESERLSRLISNVLQLARITRGDPQIDLKLANVGDLMRRVEPKLAGQVERAGFDLRVQWFDGADDAVISVDEDCFAQILINLVDNAIKFSRDAADKTIEIGCRRRTDGQVAIAVRDHGPGVPKDQMKKIFELFYRPGSELTRETVGTGIGLAIVHQLTLAMGGSVELTNADPGASFVISFPAERTARG